MMFRMAVLNALRGRAATVVASRGSCAVFQRCWSSGGSDESKRRRPWDPRARPRSAFELVAEVPPIEVEDMIARCDGGGGPLGHPVEYIQLDTRKKGAIATCKYCGLRFVHKD